MFPFGEEPQCSGTLASFAPFAEELVTQHDKRHKRAHVGRESKFTMWCRQNIPSGSSPETYLVESLRDLVRFHVTCCSSPLEASWKQCSLMSCSSSVYFCTESARNPFVTGGGY